MSSTISTETATKESGRTSPPQPPAVAQGREAMAEWERRQPDNFYESDRHLQHILELYWGADQVRHHIARLSKFGGEAATVVDQAVRRANQTENLPRLERYSAIGERIEEVTHSAEHDLAGEYIYGSGAMSVYAEPGRNLLALALFYLSSYNGEAGHNCPLACTAGVIKTLQQAGSEELKAKYLPRLLDPNYRTRFHGAQFLTEVQGGSDVGANACTAMPFGQAPGVWLINGEKWFCSNVTADLALLTARPTGAPAGTKGLGLFLVPRRLDDGSPNGMHIRRLKDKLGTRSLATAEVDFQDALAYQIGALDRGFHHVMDFVINTSRLYNAAGSAGAARRAYLVARTYAEHRRAFGEPIRNFPLIQDALAEMRAETMALLSGSLYLAQVRDEIELGTADDTAASFFRLAVNLNKYRSSLSATEVIRRGIEVLGGNGTIETFSVLPRLLRDSLIFEAWEGAHNTLLAQVVRDIQRYRVHDAYCSRLARLFASLATPGSAEIRRQGLQQNETLRSALESLMKQDEQSAGVFFRPLADQMMYLFYAACLAREAEWEEQEKGESGKRAVVEFLWHRRIAGAKAEPLPNHLQRIAEISAAL
jgi:acyl-CoA dehydrogenase